jgi:hypothetical protein
MTGSTTTRLRLRGKLRRAGSPPKRLGAKAEAIHLSPRDKMDCFASLAMTWFRLGPSHAPKASFMHSRLSRQPVGATVGHDTELAGPIE